MNFNKPQIDNFPPPDNNVSGGDDRIGGIKLEQYKEGEGEDFGESEYKTKEEVMNEAEESDRNLSEEEKKKIGTIEKLNKVKVAISHSLRVLGLAVSMLSAAFIAKGQDQSGKSNLDQEINNIKATEITAKIGQAQSELEDAYNFLEGGGKGGDGDDDKEESNPEGGQDSTAKMLADIEKTVESKLGEKGFVDIRINHNELMKIGDNGAGGKMVIVGQDIDAYNHSNETNLFEKYMGPRPGRINSGEETNRMNETIMRLDFNGDGKIDAVARSPLSSGDYNVSSQQYMEAVRHAVIEANKIDPSDASLKIKMIEEALNKDVIEGQPEAEAYSLSGDELPEGIKNDAQGLLTNDLKTINDHKDNLENGKIIKSELVLDGSPIEEKIKELKSQEVEGKDAVVMALSDPSDKAAKDADVISKMKAYYVENGGDEESARNKAMEEFLECELAFRQNLLEKNGFTPEEAKEQAITTFIDGYSHSRVWGSLSGVEDTEAKVREMVAKF